MGPIHHKERPEVLPPQPPAPPTPKKQTRRNEAIEQALNDALAFISKEYRCEKSIAVNGEFVSQEAKAVRDSMIDALAMPKADAERVGLLERIDNHMEDNSDLFDLLRDIRAYLQGGA